jgi:putative lipoprotein
MKKVFYSLLCIIGLSACSSENVVLDSLRVYDVANSTCKSSLSATETRPDFYLENDAVPATLSIELGKDGIAQCVLEDVKANCAVRNIYVNIVNQDDQITLFVYHNVLDALADCICKYDVSFKMSKLSAGNYKIKVYFARPNMKYEESDIAFNGLLNLTLNKKERVMLKSELSLPEI